MVKNLSSFPDLRTVRSPSDPGTQESFYVVCSFMFDNLGRVAVSYTHLDVYKRQVLTDEES